MSETQDASTVSGRHRLLYDHTQKSGWGIVWGVGVPVGMFLILVAASLKICLSHYPGGFSDPLLWQHLQDPEIQDSLFWVGIYLASILLTAPIMVALMATLRVTVDEHQVKVAYGIGWIHRTIPFEKIESCEVSKVSYWTVCQDCYTFQMKRETWALGFGGVVELNLKNGGLIRVGSDEPSVLCEVIRQQL